MEKENVFLVMVGIHANYYRISLLLLLLYMFKLIISFICIIFRCLPWHVQKKIAPMRQCWHRKCPWKCLKKFRILTEDCTTQTLAATQAKCGDEYSGSDGMSWQESTGMVEMQCPQGVSGRLFWKKCLVK